MVTSPGGTSAAALHELESGRLRTVLSEAVWAAYRRTWSSGSSWRQHARPRKTAAEARRDREPVTHTRPAACWRSSRTPTTRRSPRVASSRWPRTRACRHGRSARRTATKAGRPTSTATTRWTPRSGSGAAMRLRGARHRPADLARLSRSGMENWEAGPRRARSSSRIMTRSWSRSADEIRRLRPAVIVTFDRGGGYGHPDHRLVSEVATAAFERCAANRTHPVSCTTR